MAYCTLAELTDRYGLNLLVSLSDRADVPTGLVDTDVIDQAIADADDLIDGYLAARYSLPLAATPGLVRNLSLVLTGWNLHRFDAPEKLKADYAEAIRTLKSIAQGIVTLDVGGVTPEGSGNDGVRITDRDRPLTADKLKGFI